jgi:hypothetical protein
MSLFSVQWRAKTFSVNGRHQPSAAAIHATRAVKREFTGYVDGRR